MVAMRQWYALSFNAVAAPPRSPGVQPRRDALPENTLYTDTGCDLHAQCLTCPFERCRYDEAHSSRRIVMDQRDQQVIARLEGGVATVDSIAGEFNLSRRTVFRILARNRERQTGDHDE